MSALRVLAVDLGGARVGHALFTSEAGREPVLLDVGVWQIQAKNRTESPGMRWYRLEQLLDGALADPARRPDIVAYEEVRQHMSRGAGGRPAMNVDAAHAYGAGEGILLAWCEKYGVEFKSQPVSTVKAAALGKGGGPGTDKAAVLAAARRRWIFHVFEDDNAADAAFIGLAALIELGRAAKTPAAPKPPRAPRKKKSAGDGRGLPFG